MSFSSASQPTSGKQNRLRFGVQGSTEAPQASPPDGVRHLALRPIMQATNRGLRELPMPEAAQSPLLYAFCCFPGFGDRGGEAKTAPKGRFYPLEISERFWSSDSNRGQTFSGAGQAGRSCARSPSGSWCSGSPIARNR
jgi:hypothetical protein